MSHKSSISQIPRPSVKGSRPVAEILSQLPVRNPNHKPSQTVGRRISDYESRSPWLKSVVILAVSVLIAGCLWWAFLQKVAGTWNAKPAGYVAQDQLFIPEGLHPSPF